MNWRLTKTGRARVGAGLLILGSILVTVWLGIRSTSEAPPTASESAVLVVFAGLLQVAGGATIARVGRADPAHARSSVRRLLHLARRSSEARMQAEAEYETAAQRNRAVLGQLSVHLSYIEESATLAAADWVEFHGDVLRDLVDGEDGRKGEVGS